MKLGIFDSGLGGLMIAEAINRHLSALDTVYLGDTLHLPYGNRSEDTIYECTRAAMEFLLGAQDCRLVIVACNTASAAALRRLQQEWLPVHYPERRILGVVVPTLEAALERGARHIGLIGTNYIVHSEIYPQELRKINPAIRFEQQATPLLVPLIEHDGAPWLDSVLAHYLAPLLAQQVETLILGCTHYVCLKETIRTQTGLDVISQDEIIPLEV
ncbi:MAG: glutamate racemase [Alphaproteobacteria bacterium]